MNSNRLIKPCRPFLFGLTAIAIAALLEASTSFAASTWIEPGDTLARDRYQQLVDNGTLTGLSTTWPLSTRDIESQLSNLEFGSLSPEIAQLANELTAYLATLDDTALEARYGNSHEPLRGFESQSRESGELKISLVQNYSAFTGRLSVSAVDDPLDGKDFRLDNSYVAFDFSEWRFGVGYVDRWWGPGWQSSMILSNNARPSPGFFAERGVSRPFDIPILKYLGPWTASVFFNQLESDRHIPHAKLLGARVAFKPIPSLEIGLARTAQWGGDGRPESLSSLWDLILGNDNRGDDGIAEDGSNEPGNQLAGGDIRWNTRLFKQPIAFYGQLIGEDESGGYPSRYIGMAGIETPLNFESSKGRLYLEASESTMNFHRDDMPNSAYNHAIYQSGYRYYGEVIGASSDNDSFTLTLGGMHSIGDKSWLSWKAALLDLNKDGGAGNNPIAPTAIKTEMLQGRFSTELTEQVELELMAYYIGDSIEPGRELDDAGIQIAFTYRLK